MSKQGSRLQLNNSKYYLVYLVDGIWTEWTPWSGACSKPCNTGTISRHRTCTNPRPLYGGSSCPGNATEMRLCNQHSCQSMVSFRIFINNSTSQLINEKSVAKKHMGKYSCDLFYIFLFF